MELHEMNEYLSKMSCSLQRGQDRDKTLIQMNQDICGIPYVLTEVLIDKGFTKVPASVKYHGNYTGGLFDHCFEVAKKLVALSCNLELNWDLERSPFFVGMYHDMCKIDSYVCEQTKSEKSSTPTLLDWGYSKIKSPYPGHGVKSILLLEELGFGMSRQERLCILHHMGAYEKDMWNEYDSAIKETENVLWTHSADMYVSKILKI